MMGMQFMPELAVRIVSEDQCKCGYMQQIMVGGRPVSCMWHASMCHVLCVGPQWRLPCIMGLTPPLQVLGQQPDCDPARVVWQPASGARPVSCLWHASLCHVLCVLVLNGD